MSVEIEIQKYFNQKYLLYGDIKACLQTNCSVLLLLIGLYFVKHFPCALNRNHFNSLHFEIFDAARDSRH